MDFLTSKIKPMYFKYLAAAFGSALISSIYGVVDMAMVGQYQGQEGTAALAIVSPVWILFIVWDCSWGLEALYFSAHCVESPNRIRKSQMSILRLQ